jgi:hypothetical protein
VTRRKIIVIKSNITLSASANREGPFDFNAFLRSIERFDELEREVDRSTTLAGRFVVNWSRFDLSDAKDPGEKDHGDGHHKNLERTNDCRVIRRSDEKIQASSIRK